MMNKILSINERIAHIIENQYNDNQKKFAESIGYSAQVIFNIVSGRKSNPSFEVLNAIISTNDDINCEWLLTGKGSMLKREITPVVSEVDHTYKELAEARLEVIEGLRFKISSLEQTIITKEQKIAELNYTQKQSFLYPNVAEPAPELTGKKSK